MIRQVLVAWASRRPSSSVSRASAVATRPPRWITEPLGDHAPRRLGDRAHVVDLQLERRVASPSPSVVWTAQPIALSSSVARDPAVHGAERVVVALGRVDREARAALADARQVEAHELGDRRRGSVARDDRVHGLQAGPCRAPGRRGGRRGRAQRADRRASRPGRQARRAAPAATPAGSLDDVARRSARRCTATRIAMPSAAPICRAIVIFAVPVENSAGGSVAIAAPCARRQDEPDAHAADHHARQEVGRVVRRLARAHGEQPDAAGEQQRPDEARRARPERAARAATRARRSAPPCRARGRAAARRAGSTRASPASATARWTAASRRRRR